MRSWFTLFAAIALVSCGEHAEMPAPAPSVTITPAKRTEKPVFDHRLAEHAKVACESCHARSLDNPTGVEPQRPPHTACSDCHSSENYLNASTTEPLCATCHPARQILDASLKTQVLPFPNQLHQFGVRAFSHRDHMDDAKMSPAPAGYGCAFCHASGASLAAKTFPAHAECYSCHVHQAGQKFGRCQDCHAPTGESLVFAHDEGTATRDYNFLHSGHTKHKDGTAIACATCHNLTAEAPKVSDLARLEPTRGEQHKSACWGTCHIQKEETRCGKCHVRGVPLAVKTS